MNELVKDSTAHVSLDAAGLVKPSSLQRVRNHLCL